MLATLRPPIRRRLLVQDDASAAENLVAASKALEPSPRRLRQLVSKWQPDGFVVLLVKASALQAVDVALCGTGLGSLEQIEKTTHHRRRRAASDRESAHERPATWKELISKAGASNENGLWIRLVIEPRVAELVRRHVDLAPRKAAPLASCLLDFLADGRLDVAKYGERSSLEALKAFTSGGGGVELAIEVLAQCLEDGLITKKSDREVVAVLAFPRKAKEARSAVDSRSSRTAVNLFREAVGRRLRQARDPVTLLSALQAADVVGAVAERETIRSLAGHKSPIVSDFARLLLADRRFRDGSKSR